MSQKRKAELMERGTVREKTFVAEEELDFTAVQKITSFDYSWNDYLLFSWPIVDTAAAEEKKSWKSDSFPLKGNESCGQLSLTYSEARWFLSLTVDRFDEDRSKITPLNFNCIFKFKCQGMKGLGSLMLWSVDKAYVSWDCPYYPALMRPIIVEIYQFPTVIPHYALPANSSVIVGKIENFNLMKKYKKEGKIGEFRGPCFNFGTIDRYIALKALNDAAHPANSIGLSAALLIKNYGKRSTTATAGLPFIVTFTVFSEKREAKDIVKKIVVRQGAESEFRHSLLVALYDEIDALIVNDTLYFKVLLQPVERY